MTANAQSAEFVIRLYPQPSRQEPLHGLYLSHDLRTVADTMDRPFVYSDYVVSLDGRIAVPHATKPGLTVPKAVANDRDWRLFQELAVQADVVITSGRYLRDYADGRAQEILQVYDDPRFADLKEWRESRGLTPQPALAVISASLSFSIPEALTQGEREVLIFTVESADGERVAQLEQEAGQVFAAGATSVQGDQFVSRLAELGYRTIYNATGPKVLHLLLASDKLDRLYLTHANRLLGGDPFSSVVEGPLLEPPIGMCLHSIYLDEVGLDGLGQLFLAYKRPEEA
jgi:riboflavin biosynthesis pyrimidine reductase